MAKGSGTTRASSSSNPRGIGGSWRRSNPYEQTPISYLNSMANELKASARAESAWVDRNPTEWSRRNGERDSIMLSMSEGKAYGDSYTDTVIVRENSAENMKTQRGRNTYGSVPSGYSAAVRRVQEYIKKKKYDGVIKLFYSYD